MLSTVEQMLLVALSDDGDVLAHIARHAERLERDISVLLRFADSALACVPVDNPVRTDLQEIRDAATRAMRRLERLAQQSCRPHLWLVP